LSTIDEDDEEDDYGDEWDPTEATVPDSTTTFNPTVVSSLNLVSFTDDITQAATDTRSEVSAEFSPSKVISAIRGWM
jgi:hypothetical protein